MTILGIRLVMLGSRRDKRPTFGSGVKLRVVLRRSDDPFIFGVGSGGGSSTGGLASVDIIAITQFYVRKQHDLKVTMTHEDLK